MVGWQQDLSLYQLLLPLLLQSGPTIIISQVNLDTPGHQAVTILHSDHITGGELIISPNYKDQLQLLGLGSRWA